MRVTLHSLLFIVSNDSRHSNSVFSTAPVPFVIVVPVSVHGMRVLDLGGSQTDCVVKRSLMGDKPFASAGGSDFVDEAHSWTSGVSARAVSRCLVRIDAIRLRRNVLLLFPW